MCVFLQAGGIEQQQVPVSTDKAAEIDGNKEGQSIQVLQNGLEDDKYR